MQSPWRVTNEMPRGKSLPTFFPKVRSPAMTDEPQPLQPKARKPRVYLTAGDVDAIRRAAERGEAQKVIAIRFGVSASCVSLVVSGKRHVGRD